MYKGEAARHLTSETICLENHKPLGNKQKGTKMPFGTWDAGGSPAIRGPTETHIGHN